MTRPAGRAPARVTDSRIEVRRTIEARADDVFTLLATPARHVDLDPSGTVRGCRTPRPLQGVGDVFVMEMHGADRADYVVDNHVVAFESAREIAWAPATHEGERGGQVWGFHLEPTNGGGSTLVTHVYDWSGVTAERLLPYLPVVDADGLAATLERLAHLAGPTSGT